MGSRATIKDIAKAAGVSTTTVFKALNNKEKISDDVKKRILDIAKNIGYVPNRNVQALARNKLRVGVINYTK
jgi:DNA-binding LacI/PurR family transcriptional regulator